MCGRSKLVSILYRAIVGGPILKFRIFYLSPCKRFSPWKKKKIYISKFQASRLKRSAVSRQHILFSLTTYVLNPVKWLQNRLCDFERFWSFGPTFKMNEKNHFICFFELKNDFSSVTRGSDEKYEQYIQIESFSCLNTYLLLSSVWFLKISILP